MINVSLFSGIGCEILGAHWAGISTVLACEINPRCVDAGTPGRLVRPNISSSERRWRIEALGNANPPQMYYAVYRAIMEAINGQLA